MSLDHGTLNIPLSKRGDIDAQIDRYKKQVEREAWTARKAKSAQMKLDRALAKSLLDQASDDRLASLAAKTGKTIPALRKQLRSDCQWQPAIIIKFLAV